VQLENSFKFVCDFCGQKLRVDREYAGTQITCPRCEGQITVPGPEEEVVIQALPHVEQSRPTRELHFPVGMAARVRRHSAVGRVPKDPLAIAEELKRAVIERRIEEFDFERLRNRLFQFSPDVKTALIGADNVPSVYEDVIGSSYAFVGENRHRRKTDSGFSGGFYVAQKLVTQIAFRTFLAHVNYDYSEDVLDWLGETQDSEDPMVHVSWNDAVMFCRWLSLATGEYFCLPYRDEWGFAGEALELNWRSSSSAGLTGLKWKPPGMESYGKLGDRKWGPGQTGLVWEWCVDKATMHGDSRIVCAGVWPNAAEGQMGARMRERAVAGDTRVAAAGIRPMVMPGALLWLTNRGVIASSKESSVLTQYFTAAINRDGVPGGPSKPADRPAFYHGLPDNLKDRVDAFLELLLEVDAHRPRNMPLSTSHIDEGEHMTSATEFTGFSLTRVRPVEERRFEDDDFALESGTETNIQIDSAFLDELAAEHNPESSIKKLFGKLRKTLS
jgi:hypothetical protein